MTNHEQRIILAWLEAERVRTLAELEAAVSFYEVDEAHDYYTHVEWQLARVAALDTSAPALTEDERKAQAAGMLGKMVLP